MHPEHTRVTPNERLAFLDGLRGVAILLVMLYHTYARWPNLMPYHYQFTEVATFKYGHLGVQLFFMISGFVILMSLEKSASFTSFMLQRWLRLFPAMAISSAFIFFTARYLPERPAGHPVLRDLLPGLSFIEPTQWSEWVNGNQGMLEGSFWSLFVEVKFYFVFGLIYSILGSRNAVIGLSSLFLISCFIDSHWGAILKGAQLNQSLLWMNARFYGWFAAGAWCYKYFSDGRKADAVIALTLGTVAVLLTVAGKPTQYAAFIITGCFFLAILSRRAQLLFGNPVLLYLGFISYPLYLLHENLVVALTIKTARSMPNVAPALLPLPAMIFIFLLAWLIARYAEPKLRASIRSSLAGVMKFIPHSAQQADC